MLDARHQADMDARITALTALDRTLLVEAGAGSGKTSVLAGRLTSLLAAGRDPGSIAAITFTELAAGELRERVVTFVGEVAAGLVRPDLRAAFPDGPDDRQRSALVAARDRLDQLTCTTIHGFCQTLLTPYPVEAGMDPGAAIMDRAEADSLFSETLEAWLRARLSGDRRPDDVLVALVVADPKGAQFLLTEIAERLLRHRRARVPELACLDDALGTLRDAARDFRSFLDQAGCHEEETALVVTELEALLRAAPGSGAPEAEMLLHLLHLAPPASGATKAGAFRAYRKATRWKAAARAAKSAMNAQQLNDQAHACYAACEQAHQAARSYAAGRILQILAGDLRQVLEDFARAKRDAALIDFDDLLVKARDLLAGHAEIRSALGRRFTAVLVDEFQDTDPLQCEILWRLCGAPATADAPWSDWALRPGSLFLVGDPKQAIYRFRDADVACYVDARDRLLKADAGARLVIGQNFRSVSGILDWVNAQFAEPLQRALQPGFEKLFTRHQALPGRLPVATLPVVVPQGADATALRDAEADAVAAFCARIIGALQVRVGTTKIRLCCPDDIVLLAPTGTDLWRYERALEQQGIAVSTQAGKGFYRRQEVQDLIAITRVLADGRDTLALGALLRGPLVGLTEEQLLDVIADLPREEGKGLPRLRLWTPVEHLALPLLREVMEGLQTLAKHARSTTPYALLCQAVEELQVRPLVRQRQDRTAERALANVDLFLEGARAYDVRGLTAFATAMRAQWSEAQRAIEGRPDTEQRSVSLVTMHSSKGLEWPVVIPINTATRVVNRMTAAVDGNGFLHIPVSGVHGPGAEAAFAAEQAELDRERHRLWYVATTRARDLLLLPSPSCGAPTSSWMAAFPLGLDALSAFDVSGLDAAQAEHGQDAANPQDRPTFLREAALITARTHRIVRVTPHLAEAGEAVPVTLPDYAPGTDEAAVQAPPPRGSVARGLVLHKLLEEVLTGETPEEAITLQERAGQLATQLGGAPGAAELDPEEAALSVLRGLRLPPIQAARDRLNAECWVADSQPEGEAERITLGVADAVALDANGHIDLVIDWKSDVDPKAAVVSRYRSQVASYLRAAGAGRGLLVFLTSGVVEEVFVDGGF